MDYWISIILTAIVAGLIAISRLRKKEDNFAKHGIPYAKPIPIFGSMAKITLQITPFIEVMNKIYHMNSQAKYVGYYDFSCPIIMLRDPDLIKSVTIKNFDHFVDHRGVVDPIRDPLFGTNLFSLRGDNWREIRNLLSPAFTSSKMKGMFKLMTKCGEDFVDYMSELTEKQTTLTINSKDAFARYTNDVIATCAFGVTVDSLRNPKNEFYVLGKKATNLDGILSLKFLLLRNFPTIARILRIKVMGRDVENFFNTIVRETVTVRDEKGINRPDMIQLMMETRKGPGPLLTIHDMTAQAFIFFFGGFDASASFMSFVAHQLSINPDVQAKLHVEIDEIDEKFNGKPTYEAINGMPFLDAILNETSRVHPIAGILDRVCTKSIDLPPALPGAKPLHLNPGDCITIPVYSLHHDSQYFPHPDKFSPERFMENPKELSNSSTFIPFGIGPRLCIGNRFALLETKVVLYHLVRKFILKPSNKMHIPIQWSAKSLILLPKGGFWLDLQLRK